MNEQNLYTNTSSSFNMKVLTLSLFFKSTLSILVLALLFLLNTLYDEKQRNTDLYGQVLSMHEDVIYVTV